jgi:hypothetical protein
VADPITIAQQLLRRLGGLLSDEDVASWARGILTNLANEGPSFGSDEESLSGVLKRCALASGPEYELSSDDLRWLLLRLASVEGPLPQLAPQGRFLACRRPGRFFGPGRGVVSSCQRCGARVVFPQSRVPKLRECDGALMCWRCAQTFPGRVVEIGSP